MIYSVIDIVFFFFLLLETKDACKKKYFRDKAEEYMNRAESIKKLISEKKALGQYREQMKIEAGSIGYGYGSLFGRFLDDKVTHIHVEDPYIRAYHQVINQHLNINLPKKYYIFYFF